MAPSKQVTLALAAFMDSPERAALDRPGEDVREIVSRFLAVCYDDLGIEPKRLDGHHVEAVLTQLLPGRFKRGEELAEVAPDVLRAFLAHVEATEVVANSFEVRNGFEASIDDFLRTVHEGSAPQGHGRRAPQDTFQHKANKTGRNDPCICGSGKKFKKCCGK